MKLLILAAILFAACGPPAAEKSGDPVVISDTDMGVVEIDQGPLDIVPGSVQIASVSAVELSRITGRPEAGNTFVVVTVDIANGLDDAIAVAYTLFRLRVGELERLPSLESAELPGACPVDSLQSANTTLRCAVAFEMPEGATPTTIVFQAPAGPVEAPVNFQECTRCDGFCVDLNTNDAHCGSCGQEVPSSGGFCDAGVPTCADGEYDCQGSCERKTTECFFTLDRRQSCTSICAESDLQCASVEYYYQCGESEIASDPDLGCDDTPPPNWDQCGAFSDTDCRCLP